jgi:hypothetical protein
MLVRIWEVDRDIENQLISYEDYTKVIIKKKHVTTNMAQIKIEYDKQIQSATSQEW